MLRDIFLFSPVLPSKELVSLQEANQSCPPACRGDSAFAFEPKCHIESKNLPEVVPCPSPSSQEFSEFFLQLPGKAYSPAIRALLKDELFYS